MCHSECSNAAIGNRAMNRSIVNWQSSMDRLPRRRVESEDEVADRPVQLAEAVRRAGRDDDDVARADAAGLAALPRALLAHAGVEAREVDRLGTAERTTGHQRARPPNDVVGSQGVMGPPDTRPLTIDN